MPDIGFLKTNQSDIENAAENNGYGQRYRVRIMGYHTANKTELPDDELPFASLMYPVTAGGGNMGASQSSNITEGTFVFGFFLPSIFCFHLGGVMLQTLWTRHWLRVVPT